MGGCSVLWGGVLGVHVGFPLFVGTTYGTYHTPQSDPWEDLEIRSPI